MGRPALSPQAILDSCLCHRTRMAARVVTRAYDDALRPIGLRGTQLAVLAAIAARGSLSITELADSMQMERTTLRRNLDPLVAQDLVSVAPEGRQRRRLMKLTRNGQALFESALPLWLGAQDAMRERLGKKGWPAVEDALTQLVAWR